MCPFLDQGIHPMHTINDISAEGTAFNVFSYDAVLAENQTHYLCNAEWIRYATAVGFTILSWLSINNIILKKKLCRPLLVCMKLPFDFKIEIIAIIKHRLNLYLYFSQIEKELLTEHSDSEKIKSGTKYLYLFLLFI